MTPVAGHRVVLGVAAHRVRADAADRHLGVRAGIPVRRRAVDRARDPVDARRPRARRGGHVLGARGCRRLARARQRDRRLLVVDVDGLAVADRVAGRVRGAQRQGLRALAVAVSDHRVAGRRGIALVPHPRALGRAAAGQRLAAEGRVHRAQAQTASHPRSRAARFRGPSRWPATSPKRTSMGRPSRAPRARSPRPRCCRVRRTPYTWACRRRAGNRSSSTPSDPTKTRTRPELFVSSPVPVEVPAVLPVLAVVDPNRLQASDGIAAPTISNPDGAVACQIAP